MTLPSESINNRKLYKCHRYNIWHGPRRAPNIGLRRGQSNGDRWAHPKWAHGSLRSTGRNSPVEGGSARSWSTEACGVTCLGTSMSTSATTCLSGRISKQASPLGYAQAVQRYKYYLSTLLKCTGHTFYVAGQGTLLNAGHAAG